jgi:hypothetical protein
MCVVMAILTGSLADESLGGSLIKSPIRGRIVLPGNTPVPTIKVLFYVSQTVGINVKTLYDVADPQRWRI